MNGITTQVLKDAVTVISRYWTLRGVIDVMNVDSTKSSRTHGKQQ